jgi:tight adherence protein C
MTLILAALAAAGLALTVLGAPPLRRGWLAGRVDPYVSGLYARRSGLLDRGRSRGFFARRLEIRGARPEVERRIARRLAAAGDRRTVAEFRVEQLTWGLTGSIGAWALLWSSGSIGLTANPLSVPFLGVLTFMCGWLGRDWWLGRQVERRKSELQDELPTAIDLVTLALMAGEAVPAAFARVAATVGSGIGEEFDRVVADVRAGSSTIDALEALKNRLPDYATVRFVDALCTGIEKGTPLADVLRAQADDVREARRRRLIELGGRREVLMLVPVVFLIMPVVVVFALLPGLVSLDLLVP